MCVTPVDLPLSVFMWIEQFDEGSLSTMVSTKTGVKGIKAVSQHWEAIRELLNHSFFNNFTDTYNDGEWPKILK